LAAASLVNPEEMMTNPTVRYVVCSALGLLLAGSGSAFAQDPPAPADGTAPPAATTEPAAGAVATTPPPVQGTSNATDVTLRPGGISIDGDVAIGMASGAAGKPISIVPNAYYGVTDTLTVGLASNPNSEIFQNVAGAGLCLSGEADGCAKIYNNISLDGLFSFSRSGTMDVAAHGGLDTIFGENTLAGLRAGVKGKLLAGPLVLVFDPWIRFGLNNRDFNKEMLNIPVRVGFMATPQLNVGVSTGIWGMLNPPVGGFGDLYVIPVGAGATFAISDALAARAQFTFDNLAGKNGGADFRTFSLGAVYRM
jgi:hypothetical protein